MGEKKNVSNSRVIGSSCSERLGTLGRRPGRAPPARDLARAPKSRSRGCCGHVWFFPVQILDFVRGRRQPRRAWPRRGDPPAKAPEGWGVQGTAAAASQRRLLLLQRVRGVVARRLQRRELQQRGAAARAGPLERTAAVHAARRRRPRMRTWKPAALRDRPRLSIGRRALRGGWGRRRGGRGWKCCGRGRRRGGRGSRLRQPCGPCWLGGGGLRPRARG